jgi:hypothetical protein
MATFAIAHLFAARFLLLADANWHRASGAHGNSLHGLHTCGGKRFERVLTNERLMLLQHTKIMSRNRGVQEGYGPPVRVFPTMAQKSPTAPPTYSSGTTVTQPSKPVTTASTSTAPTVPTSRAVSRSVDTVQPTIVSQISMSAPPELNMHGTTPTQIIKVASPCITIMPIEEMQYQFNHVPRSLLPSNAVCVKVWHRSSIPFEEQRTVIALLQYVWREKRVCFTLSESDAQYSFFVPMQRVEGNEVACEWSHVLTMPCSPRTIALVFMPPGSKLKDHKALKNPRVAAMPKALLDWPEGMAKITHSSAEKAKAKLSSMPEPLAKPPR